MNNKSKWLLIMGLAATPLSCLVWSNSAFIPDFSLILDGHYKSSASALSETEKGFGLGHTELAIRGGIKSVLLPIILLTASTDPTPR